MEHLQFKNKKKLSPLGCEHFTKASIVLTNLHLHKREGRAALEMGFFSFLPHFDMPLPLSSGQVTSPHPQRLCMSSPF